MKQLRLSKPHLITVVGIPGSGKSTFAEKFAETFNAPLLSFETVVRLVEGQSELIIPVLNLQLEQLLRSQATIIVDGYTDTRTERQDLAKQAKAAGYEFLVVWVQTDQETSKTRSVKPPRRSGRTPMPLDQFEKILKRFTPPNEAEKPVVISGKHTYASQARTVLARLSQERAQEAKHLAPTAPRPTRAPERSSKRRIGVQ